ncbi:protein canopy 4 [Caerostris extrusa]|uniref:Protein canopy 4 n=1 Tax=Caerostris extrusa TaxID=172846 RepID=A0AAV4VBP6_CAEEX|nr:protein canopy 4 [Caerostris extrusa]
MPLLKIKNLQCENLLEKHEADIEDWYFKHQDIPLKQFLCIDKALDKGDTGCLDETFVSPPPKKEEKEDSKKTKGESKKAKSKKKSEKPAKKSVKYDLSPKGDTKVEL